MREGGHGARESGEDSAKENLEGVGDHREENQKSTMQQKLEGGANKLLTYDDKLYAME
jgi:hypothetical protein